MTVPTAMAGHGSHLVDYDYACSPGFIYSNGEPLVPSTCAESALYGFTTSTGYRWANYGWGNDPLNKGYVEVVVTSGWNSDVEDCNYSTRAGCNEDATVTDSVVRCVQGVTKVTPESGFVATAKTFNPAC